ncbi:MAG TPA: AgmX/PglI C-terminal domain-containing protein, partial [Candidatus Binataceae bacterium]
MKSCPRCDRTYPDGETFCEADGTALVSAGPAFAQGGARTTPELGGGARGSVEAGIECPVCGGRAEPGEIICNFCGARLDQKGSAAPARAATEPAPPAPPPQRTAVTPAASRPLTSPIDNEEAEGRSIIGVVGYVLAAVIALAGGAWLALHLSSRQAAQQAASSPTPAAASSPVVPSGPLVAIAGTIPIQVSGESASAPERNQDAAHKVFDDNKSALTDAYSHALSGDSSLHDGMVVRLRVMPDGSVAAGTVRTSTAPNPGLDAEVVKDMSAWKYPSFSGGQVEVDYPVIFARDAADQTTIESELSTKLATLSPTEPAEYASAPGAGPSAAAAESPAAEATPPAVAAISPPVARPRRAPAARPTPTLLERVQTTLKSKRKLGRVHA